ncbi:MAG: peptidoglycan DD-metalloendopeptidase family protein [Anaerolineales bacterium]
MAKRHRAPLRNPNLQGLLVLAVVVIIAGVYLVNNRSQPQRLARPAQPTAATDSTPNTNQFMLLQQQFTALPSPTSTPTTSPTPFMPPTDDAPLATARAFNPSPLPVRNLPTPQSLITQTPPPSPAFVQNTPVPLPTGVEIGSAPNFEENPQRFEVPPEEVPLSAHPFDHYWLARPIDVTANSEYLFYYPYGSGGDGWRVHHGIDIPNPVGEEVRAAGPGTVVYAGSEEEQRNYGDLEIYVSYGNVVVIEHDFGWRGQPVWTLYAHMSAMLVSQGDRVDTGDIIGLVGVSGYVTGPHVHFEIRLGTNSYFSTRNPLLWMAPYLGHGVVAGRVTDAEGAYIENAIVQLNQDGNITDRTTTYTDAWEEGARVWSVVPDDNWRENFALGDIPEGTYELIVLVEGRRYFESVRVNAGVTTFVEMQIDAVATPQPFQEETPLGGANAGVPTTMPTGLPSPTPN